MGENNRFSFAKTSFGKLHSELSGFLVGEIASLDYSLSVFVGLVINHSITRGQLSIAGCVLLTLSLVSLIHCITVCTAVYSEVSSLCQTPSDSEGEVAYNSYTS